MEQIKAAVDEDVYQKLKGKTITFSKMSNFGSFFAIEGFRCHICSTFVPGYVGELKLHFQQIHKLNTSSNERLPFKCSECGAEVASTGFEAAGN